MIKKVKEIKSLDEFMNNRDKIHELKDQLDDAISTVADCPCSVVVGSEVIELENFDKRLISEFLSKLMGEVLTSQEEYDKTSAKLQGVLVGAK